VVSYMVSNHPKVFEDGERRQSELLALVGDVMTDGIEGRGAESTVMAYVEEIRKAVQFEN
jgi:hypothetical protein